MMKIIEQEDLIKRDVLIEDIMQAWRDRMFLESFEATIKGIVAAAVENGVKDGN